jgi:hypothetical protein
VDATQPIGAILGAKDEVLVARDLRPVLGEEHGQPRLELVLMGDEEVAMRAVPARLIQCDQLQRFNVDERMVG